MGSSRWAALFLLAMCSGVGQLMAEVTPESQTSGSARDSYPEAPQSRPPAREAVRGFLTDSVGPYSIFMGAATAAIHQGTDNPPEWRQGFIGLSERFGSNMGITGVGNAVRYGTGWATNSDFRFQKCKCSGVPARLGHAFKSTAIAHRRSDGSAVPSLPNLFAPYAATTTAIYAWYPSRYGIKDAFRMGNYNLLGTVASNIVWEFMPEKAMKFLHHFHLSGSH